MARVTLRLPDRLHSKARKMSQEKGVSLNDLIVGALESTVAGGSSDLGNEDSVLARAARLRIMLGDLAAPVEPPKEGELLWLNATLTERKAFRDSMPILDPPLSASIIEDREDRV